MKHIVLRQYQEIVDRAAELVAGFSTPPEGWIRTLRSALGMSGAQLARRMKVSRSSVAQAEKNEVTGAITLKTLNNMAQAMDCRVVYMIVPETSAGALVKRRARDKAEQIVTATDIHMALESQALGDDKHQFEVERLQRELVSEVPSDLWNDL